MFVRQKSHEMKNSEDIWILGHKLRRHDASGDFDMGVFETPAGAQGPPPHLHGSYQETFLILEGEMEFFIDGEIKTLTSGESMDVPTGTLHTFNNKSDQTCKWVNIHSPKGFFRFFEEMGVPDTEEGARHKSVQPEIIEKVITMASDFDMTIPPPPKN